MRKGYVLPKTEIYYFTDIDIIMASGDWESTSQGENDLPIIDIG